MHVAAVAYDIHVGASQSLKAKRAVVRPVVEGLRHRFAVSASEVDHQDTWQRATIGIAAVSGSYDHLCEVLDACDRFVWSHPELDVLSAQRHWLDADS